MKFCNKNKVSRDTSGFTVIELGIFVAVFGIILSMFLNEYSQYKRDKAVFDTLARKTVIIQALSSFVGNFGRLPCPADPSLAPNNTSAGLEQCTAGVGVISTAGARLDLTDDVLIGAVPYVTLGISSVDAMDGWGAKFTYAVTKRMTNASTYDDDEGVIRKLSRSLTLPDNPPAGPSPNDGGDLFPELAKLSYGDKADAFLIALVSHGKDNRGGYNYYGNLIAPCDTVTPSLDSENCDGDAIFLSAETTTGIYNLVRGPLYFDDTTTAFTINRDGDKWAYASGNSIKNKTMENVGIGKIPEYKLDINGNMIVGNGVTSKIRATKYCELPDASGHYHCFRPRIIAGTGIKCRRGILTGINNSNVRCVENIDTSNISTGNCPTGQYIIGIDAGGNLICSP